MLQPLTMCVWVKSLTHVPGVSQSENRVWHCTIQSCVCQLGVFSLMPEVIVWHSITLCDWRRVVQFWLHQTWKLSTLIFPLLSSPFFSSLSLNADPDIRVRTDMTTPFPITLFVLINDYIFTPFSFCLCSVSWRKVVNTPSPEKNSDIQTHSSLCLSTFKGLNPQLLVGNGGEPRSTVRMRFLWLVWKRPSLVKEDGGAAWCKLGLCNCISVITWHQLRCRQQVRAISTKEMPWYKKAWVGLTVVFLSPIEKLCFV